MSDVNSKVPFIVLEPMGPSISKLIEDLTNEGSIDLHLCQSPAKVLAELRKQENPVLILHSRHRGDVVAHMGFLRMFSRQIKTQKMKVILTSETDSPEALSEYEKVGITDVLAEPVREKTLSFKLKKILQAAQASRKSTEGPAQKKREAQQKQEQAKKKSGGQVVYDEPFSSAQDFWLLNGKEPKKVMNRWMITLMGPSPAVGRWAEVDQPGERPHWKWVGNGKMDCFVTQEGDWVYAGYKPEFRGLSWAMMGEDPLLMFVPHTGEKVLKITLGSDGTLKVKKDSTEGKTLLPKIHQSIAALDEQIKDKKDARLGGVDGEEAHFSSKEKGGVGSEYGDHAPGEFSDSSGNAEFENKDESFNEIQPEKGSSEQEFLADESVHSESGSGEFLPDDITDPEIETKEAERSAPKKKKKGKSAFQKRLMDRLKKKKKVSEQTLSLLEEYQEDIETGKRRDGEREGVRQNFRSDELMQAMEAPGPSLRALSLGFVTSELMNFPGRDLREISERFCSYLSHSCGGLPVEFWVKRGKEWDAIIESDTALPESAQCLDQIEKEAIFLKRKRMILAGIFDEETLIGAVVIGGQNIDSLSPEYVSRAAVALKGVALGLTQAQSQNEEEAA